MERLKAPENGITVRMYRQGHGDCFLLAMPREGGGKPVYVLIDCGLKPGSQKTLPHQKGIGDIVKDIAAATNKHLDLVIVTHEHQDHLNGFWKKRNPYFGPFTIDKAWLAWTEDPNNDLANELRKRHRDQLLGLVAARMRLAAAGDNSTVQHVDSLLSLEFGGDTDVLDAGILAAVDPASSENKQALKLIKDKVNARNRVEYLDSAKSPVTVPGTSVRAFVLGPPEKEDLLIDEEPRGNESFPNTTAKGLGFAAAAGSMDGGMSPFAPRYVIPMPSKDDPRPNMPAFFESRYGKGDEAETYGDEQAVPDNAPWRRIDNEWLYSAEWLALKLNEGINNTSLVLAFELPVSRKVLLFIGDAQRGSWSSWSELSWDDGDDTITARDLLGRTVLYKVGHHGSHNATLAGNPDDSHANLSWMANGRFADEFVAMIPAVSDWALAKKRPWVHPLPSIRNELLRKAQGRVFQTNISELTRPDSVPETAWQAFIDRCDFRELSFDYTIIDA